jgi:hypothetical protein
VKHLLAFVLALLCGAALATGNHPAAPSPNSNAAADAHSAANSAASATSGSASAYGGASGDSSLYVLPAPVGGANLPAGMCQTSKYDHVAVIWNFVSVAKGDSRTDLECLQLLMRLEDLKRQPIPVKPVAYVTADSVNPADSAIRQPEKTAERQLTCTAPAKAKTVAAAKAAGACKS